MKLEKSGNMTFFESFMGQIKTRRSEFFKKVNSIIDWRWLEGELDKVYKFHSELVRKKAYDRLLRKINKQLEHQGVKVKKGKTIVDASVTISPYAPKCKTTYEIAEDRNEDDLHSEKKKY